jgi:hypothetical protein
MLIGSTTIDVHGTTVSARYRLFRTITSQFEGDLLVDTPVHLHAFLELVDDPLSVMLEGDRVFRFVVTGATLPDTLHVVGRVAER